jgi:hypothetical protein
MNGIGKRKKRRCQQISEVDAANRVGTDILGNRHPAARQAISGMGDVKPVEFKRHVSSP